MGSISDAASVSQPRGRARIGRLRVTRDGLSTLVLLVPFLVVFGLFAWFPILRGFVMSVQETNLVSEPVFVGLDNFARVLADPLLGKAVANTLWFMALALVFGYPIPIVLAVLMSEVRRWRGLYSALAYLPVVVPPVVAVLLWRFFYDASPDGVFNTILGWVGLGPLP
jgi:multiple sugar transport system permease protein